MVLLFSYTKSQGVGKKKPECVRVSPAQTLWEGLSALLSKICPILWNFNSELSVMSKLPQLWLEVIPFDDGTNSFCPSTMFDPDHFLNLCISDLLFREIILPEQLQESKYLCVNLTVGFGFWKFSVYPVERNCNPQHPSPYSKCQKLW